MSSRIPSATYRLQLNREFPLSQAIELVGYLHDLGISDCYLSPITQARPGSIHGYDVVNHRAINPELGTSEDLHRFSKLLQAHEMGIVADIVPNHMAISDPENRWWRDVLENGPGSAYADFFDIDWNPPKDDLRNKVLLPVLGDQFGRVLEDQQISVSYDEGSFLVHCYGSTYPIAPRSLGAILKPAWQALMRSVGDSTPEVLELESIMNAAENLPPRTESDLAKVRARRRELPVIKRRISELYRASSDFRSALDYSLKGINGVKGDPRSFDRLESLLDDQPYRLSFWKVAADEINYRRFFDINELAAIRMEDRSVFSAAHGMIFDLVSAGIINGLRIDHVDGLLDPLEYLRRLQTGAAAALSKENGQPLSDPERPFYVVVEKIIGEREVLQPWPVYGTTGYDFMNVIGRVFVEAENRPRFRDLYARFIEQRPNFRDIVYESKKLILRTAMSGELAVLSRRLDRISEQHRWSRDFTLHSLAAALAEVIACFPVYRSYVRPEAGEISEDDRQHITTATSRAKRRNPTTNGSVFDFIASVLLLENPEGLNSEQLAERAEFVLRFQQLTSPVMAKGFEDTALYRYYPLASLNEVGGEPDNFGIGIDTFHQWSRARLEKWPAAMSATSTHDTKRSEETRLRISALSEIPEEWEQAVQRWYRMNSAARKQVEDGRDVPDRNEEYLLYQTMVGIWPADQIDPAQHTELIERIQAYMEKAVKEAKVHTSWMNANEEHDRALSNFLAEILEPNSEFVADLSAFVKPIARAGMLNSLSQTQIKIALPGVPDFYQGTELWATNLVDPDNRRPVDYQLRRALLAKIRESARRDPAQTVRNLMRDIGSGAIKMYVTASALEFRRNHQELFMRGDYVALETEGTRAYNAVAFARSLGLTKMVVVCGRFFMGTPEGIGHSIDPDAWSDTFVSLPGDFAASLFKDVFTARTIRPDAKGRLPLNEVLAEMPVAMLLAET